MKTSKIISIFFFILILIFQKLGLTKFHNDYLKKEKCQVIKLIWYQIPNGGDYFGKWLLEKMGLKVEYSETPDVVVCGSILGFNITYSKIWGAGFHFANESTHIKEKNLFYAVRGKLSMKMLNLKYPMALGDPGLLLSRFFKPKTIKTYNICIISHYIDFDFFINTYKNKLYIINMGINNIEEIANSINKCNFTFSSSLHGIIFSHSLGIPSVHLENNVLSSINNFKFKDYYSTLDISYVKEDLKKENINTIIKKYNNSNLSYKFLPSKKVIKQIQDNLLFNFPYKKCLYNYQNNTYYNYKR